MKNIRLKQKKHPLRNLHLFFLFTSLLCLFAKQSIAYDYEDYKTLIKTNKCEACRLDRSNLSGKNLENAKLKESRLKYSNLKGIHLNKADLSSAQMKKANLTKAYLNKTNLTNADLYRAKLRKANFKNATLIGANMQKSDMRWADFTGANLTNAKIAGADIRHAIFSYATWINGKKCTYKSVGRCITKKMKILKQSKRCVGCNLRNTNLSSFKLRKAHLQRADLR